MKAQQAFENDTTAQAQQVLAKETAALLQFLHDVEGKENFAYEVIESRLDYFKAVTQSIEAELRDDREQLRAFRNWFKQESEPIFRQSQLMTRARTWPEGYPGDYVTLEKVYTNNVGSDTVVGTALDRYFTSRTLAVAVRSRLRKMAELLNRRAAEETGAANWLNLACGSCRELLSVARRDDRTVWCLDQDPNALNYAAELLRQNGKLTANMHFETENAFKLANHQENIARFGQLTTIYSAGLFDYIQTEELVALLSQLYLSLADGGALIAPFKDRQRYDTFDYHWVAKWHFFLQRTEEEFEQIMLRAGVPADKLSVERDDSGVILFFVAKK